MNKERLTRDDFARAAAILGCDVPAVMAVAQVESLGSGFLPDGQPVILFEAHVFSRLTGHQFDESHPRISSRTWNRKLYGAPGQHQHDRLREAVQLNRDAALKACSWGAFQVLAENWERLGYHSLQDFINAAYRSEAAHLDMFVRFVKVSRLHGFLRAHDWARFARGYNGPGYAANGYDKKMAAAYRKMSNVK